MDRSEPRLARIEALSDGVFGVALTLLLLEIRPKGEISGQDWWHQVFLNSQLFAASFFLVGIYWVAHKNEWVYLTRSDRFVDYLNLVFLATVAVLPFSVSVLAESWHSYFGAPADSARASSLDRAVGLYLGNVASTGIALSLLFGYVAVRRWLNARGRQRRVQTIRRNASLPLLCAFAWACYKMMPDWARANFSLLMTFPPALYLGFTLSVAIYKALRRRHASAASPG